LPPLALPSEESRFLAWLTEGMTGSDIRTMTNALKRHVGLSNGHHSTIFELARQFAITHAGSTQYKRLSLLGGSPQQLVHAAMQDDQLQMTQEVLASIIGKDQTTISRWLSRPSAARD